MSKVLISFLGTGLNNKDKSKDQRQYPPANYRFDDGDQIERSFIALALKEHYQIDRVILIGTTHSMWEAVYDEFAKNSDNKYWAELADFCDNAGYNTPLDSFPSLDKLNASIGDNSKAILIHYGLNKEEILDNQQIILSIEQLLINGDELYVDITHSFRSLPMFLLNSLIYIQNVSKKKVTIKSISYGMRDAASELGYTPVVDLIDIIGTTDWIMGAYAFKEFGNAYKIAELTKKEGDKDVGNRLENFSNAMNLNAFDIIKNQTDIFALRNREFSSRFSQLLVDPIVEDFSKSFLRVSDKALYVFQINLAEWHTKHHNYSSAYICLVESIVSYVCYLTGKDDQDMNTREEVKQIIKYPNKKGLHTTVINKCLEIKDKYIKLNKIRNTIAHSTEESHFDGSIQDYVRVLKESLSFFKKVLV